MNNTGMSTGSDTPSCADLVSELSRSRDSWPGRRKGKPFRYLVPAPTLALLLVLLSFPSAGAQEPEPATGENREFGVIDNSDDMRTIPVKQVASLMKELGYKSVAVSTEEPQFNERMNAFREASLRIGGVSLKWTTDGQSDNFNIPMDLVLSKVRDTGAIVMFGIAVKDGATVTDARIVEQLRARAEEVQKAGVTLGIYPHLGFRVSRFEHATRVAEAVDHPALGVCFVLSHYMKQSDQKDLPARLRAAKARIVAAVINGSATGNTKAMGWDRLIQHIDQGEFDLPALLDLLCGELKFKGPVFVQCVNIPAPTRRTLEVTHTKWQDLKRHCRVTSKAGKKD